jgi:hypothetical protein
MKFNLSEISSSAGLGNSSPYLTYGSRQELRINKIELSKSQNTGNAKAILYVETPPVKEDGFVGIDNHSGRVGKVGCGVYMKTDEQKTEFLANLKTIAEAMGLGKDIDMINGDTFEEVVEKIENLFVQSKKYARFTIYAEEYPKSGRTGVKLFLPRFNFVESLDVTEDKSKLAQFNPLNARHYKKLPDNVVPDADDSSDLPF